ncbi:MAG: hypothetical protein KC776_31480 [Myxococcales bacterium]|nr:hypothetical protein [Myxococcales bacterium]MCB9579418.1 hypothetical protein [Polyangiaceae bacterium]
MRKPSGPWEAATEPAGTDPVDPEDGPTLQVFVPSQGPARVLGNTDDDLVETTKQPLPRFEELTGSGFYETITKPRRWEQEELDEASTLRRSERDELDEAATLRRPPGLPPLPLPPPPRPWAAPEPPLKTDPFPLLPPPKSEPFPLLEHAPPEDPVIEVAPELSLAPPVLPPAAFHPPMPPPPPAEDPRLVPLVLRLTSDRTAIAAAIGVFAAITVVGVVVSLVLVARSRSTTPAPSTAAATAPIAPAAVPASVSCRLSELPRRLAPEATFDITPQVAAAPGDKIAVGFVTPSQEAVGLIVSLDGLSTETRLRKQGSGRILSVSPLPHRSPVTFAVDEPVATLQLAKTIGSMRLGATSAGIVRLEPGRDPSVVWPGPPGTITTLSAASLEGVGTAVALGRGGESGDVVFGWLSSDGSRGTDLGRLAVGQRRVGAPAVAAGDGGALTVFAAHGTGEPWSLYAALAKPGKLPVTTVRLEPGDVPANQRGPVVAALPSGGFLLAWREGRRLRARPLDAALRATGPIVEIANDIDLVPAPGALGVRHDRVLSLYGVRSGNATELWGAVLSCS